MSDQEPSARSVSFVTFTSDPSVQPFCLSPPAFLARHFTHSSATRPPAARFIATGAIVFDRPLSVNSGPEQQISQPPPHVLLVQRAPTDSMPLRWETPGGACDDDDVSVLHACARELKEEAGLTAASVGPLVRLSTPAAATTTTAGDDGQQSELLGESMGGQFFLTRRANLVCKFYFVVEPADVDHVVLDPAEHTAYVWATEEEVRNKKMEGTDGIQLNFTTKEQQEVILEAFKLWKK
ncbi:NUDIX hydrolase domain-like protein [Apodospora peruviana]|uniref:NUDIX hydrolase domain-like protein n=1 Tax=Apodospora peruviana TaxID=516989 RepID=A0AAE0IAY9_9PEZI|nr:NUDIX hydrolase domain-like protein [Apodospora peruviana]